MWESARNFVCDDGAQERQWQWMIAGVCVLFMKRTLLFGHFCGLVLHLNIYNHHGTPFIMEICHNCIHVSTQPTHISFHTNYKPYIFIPFIAWLEDWVFQFIICQNKIATENELEKTNTLLFLRIHFRFQCKSNTFLYVLKFQIVLATIHGQAYTVSLVW